MKKCKRILAAVLGVSVIALAGCDLPWGGGYDDAAFMDMMDLMGEDLGINVETAYPVVRTISQNGSYIGTIETGDKVSVTPRVSGYVKEKFYGLGDHVNAGDILFTIDDTDLQLARKKAEADVKDASAALAKDKADNEATKFEVNETLNTLDEKTLENYDNIQKAIRTEYEARLDLYKVCTEEGLYRKEGEYIDDLIKNDKNAIENSEQFAQNLKGFRSNYNNIKNAGADAENVAVNTYGVNPADITAAGATTPDAIATVYLVTKTAYLNINELDKASHQAKLP